MILIVNTEEKCIFSYVVDGELQLAIPRPALDAGPLYALIAADRATFERYLPWVKDTQTAADEQAALTLFNQHFGARTSANLVLVVAGQPAGMISFNGFHDENVWSKLKSEWAD
ncbi:hypothetical protein [Lacticaseibacillus jixianensis]|uniref:hypothetical protein n=1 Tax=Lacticaseibacillus jixianensis TaxID=2486012 RepID=UPI0013DDC186|nr:hypothetical protein [Lacticaseibacillus jixianensis]